MALSYNTSLTDVVARYLQLLKVPFTREALRSRLRENPYYPSLYSIKNVLDRFNIPNEAFNLKTEHWDDLRPPFITYMKNTAAGKDFVLVTAANENEVTFIHRDNKAITLKKEDFLARWENLLLVAEPNPESGDPGYRENLVKEKKEAEIKNRLLAAAAALAILVMTGFFTSLSNAQLLTASLIAVTKGTGLAVTILLLLYERDQSIAFVKNICSAGKQTSCDAVLNSKASGIAGIRWSEAGFIYFAATLLFLLLPSISFTGKITWLAIAATLVLPYIAFSLYYQYRVVKQWCPFCLLVQGVLMLEGIWAVIIYWRNPGIPLFSAGIAAAALFCLLLPAVTWFFLKPLIGMRREMQQYQAAYKRLLYNPEQFTQLLRQQAKAPQGWQQLGITIGNPAAENTIIKVCNPYCGPCAKAHPELEEIIRHNHNFNLKIIFTATAKKEDRSYFPAKHLLAVASKNNPEFTQQALDDWYHAGKKDYETFAARYPMNGELKQQDEKINAMNTWCGEAGIFATPTIFINGYQLPENYTISELKHIL